MEGAANHPGVCVTRAASLPGAGAAVPHAPSAELQSDSLGTDWANTWGQAPSMGVSL